MNYFIEQIKNQKCIDIKYFKASIETTKAILKLKTKTEVKFN
jgi:hypothetical protein